MPTQMNTNTKEKHLMSSTLGSILDRAGVDTLGVLDAQVDVPVLTGLAQAQGDLIILPRPHKQAATKEVPAAGALVVQAESSGGNTHSLHSWDGPSCYWDASGGEGSGNSGLVLGTLTVPDNATAYLVHTEEHGANAFGPGTYEIRRQREQADEIRLVAD